MNILDAIQEALVPKPTSVMDPNYKEPTQGEMFRNGIARQLMSYLTFPADMLIESRNILNKDDRMPTLAERGAKSLGLTEARPFTTDQATMDLGAALTDVAPLGLMATGPSKAQRGIKNQVGAIDVSHGSPHKFDQFDFSKIGTGEGAQAYGHGGYVAEGFNSPVATGYQKRLGGNVTNTEALGEYFKPGRVLDKGGSFDKVLEFNPNGGHDWNVVVQEVNSKGVPIGKPRVHQTNPTDIEFKRVTGKDKGYLYNARMAWPDAAREAADPLGPQHFLDWDKPLSEQPKAIQEFVQSLRAKQGDPFNLERFFSPKNPNGGPLGSEVYEAAVNQASAQAREAVRNGQYIADTAKHGERAGAEALRELGIPGIRYLDQNSRSNFRVQNTYKGKPYGEPVSFMTEAQAKDYAAEQIAKGFGVEMIPGTSNYVVFPGGENLLTILERNGQPVR